MKPQGWNAAPLEVAPSADSERCTEPGCGNVPFSKGLCRSHYHKQYRAQGGKKEAPREPLPEITQAAVETMVVTSMGFLAMMVDESFSAQDIKTKPDGSVETITTKPHVREAVSEMMPWFKIHGGTLMRAMPWFGLIGGAFALALPAFEPTTEIIAGVRKPRIFRRPTEGDPDIYSDRYKAAQRARQAKEAQTQAGNQTRAPTEGAASAQTISVVPEPERKAG